MAHRVDAINESMKHRKAPHGMMLNSVMTATVEGLKTIQSIAFSQWNKL
jgi:hypothetical protein